MQIQKFYPALNLVLALSACSTPAITTPSPTQVSQPPPFAATRAPAPTQPGSPSPIAAAPTQPASIVPPPCSGTLAITPSTTEGPFYKANTPEKTSLVEPGVMGAKITLSGTVLTRECKPIGRAMVDVWQTDDKGEYDNAGYRMRGHVFSDAAGRYAIETIIPGLYPGRTRHIHVKVIAPNQPALTTQLYFPNESRNASDSIFDRALLVNMQDSLSGKIATFNFVLGAR